MEMIPRGPVIMNEKSGTLDYTDSYKLKLKSFREGAKEQAMRELQANKEWSQIGSYTRALEGAMWPKNRAPFRSRFVDNQLSRARTETLAQYTDVRPAISVKGPGEFAQQADILTKQCYHSWIHERMDLELVGVLDHAMLAAGYWKVNGARGRVSVMTCGMDTVMPINCPGNIQKASAVLYRTFKPIPYFFQRFGKDFAEKVLRSARGKNTGRPDSNIMFPGASPNDYSWARLSPSMKYIQRDINPDYSRTDTNEAFPVGELEEIWVEDYHVNELRHPVIVKDPNSPTTDHNYWYRVDPGQRLYPRKRLMVFGGDQCAYDSTTPYWYDGYPFAMLVLNPIVWGAGGLSKYRSLLPLNQGINEVSTGIFDTVKKAINQAYVAKRGSVNPADWERFFPEIPGQKMLLNNTADIRDVRALEAPNLPAYVFEFGRYLMSDFDRHAGSTDVGGLMKKKQVPGGDAMEQIRDMQSAPSRLEGRYIEIFLRDAGTIAVSHFLQFYNRQDRYWILGPDGVTWEDYAWDPSTMIPGTEAQEAHWKRYRVIVAPGSLHGANKDRAKIEALTLFKAGALSMETLLEKSELVDPAKEMERIKAERGAGIGPQPVAHGRTPRSTRGQRNAQIA